MNDIKEIEGKTIETPEIKPTLRLKSGNGHEPTPKLRLVVNKDHKFHIEQLFRDGWGNMFWAPISEVDESDLPDYSETHKRVEQTEVLETTTYGVSPLTGVVCPMGVIKVKNTDKIHKREGDGKG